MMTVTTGRPRHRPATDEDAARDVYRMVASSARNRRKPPPVTLAGLPRVTADVPPVEAIAKPPRRYWRKWD